MRVATREISGQGRDVLKEISLPRGIEPALTREYEAIFKSNGKPMVIVEEDATISLVNAEFVRLSGYTKEEIEGKKNWMEFVARDDRRRVKEYHRLRRSDPILSPRCFEFRFRDRYGKIKNIVLTIGQVPGTNKNMASLLDVTDRKQAEATLRVSEGRYKAIFENSRDAIYITTADGTYIDANQAALDLFGYTREEMKKVNAGQLYADPADARRFQQEIEGKGFVRDFEVRLRKKDGTEMDCLFTVTAQRGDDGGILEYQGIIRDITERRQMDEELRQSEERYRTVVNNINLGVNHIDADHTIVMVNAAGSKQIDKPVTELIGKKCFREFEKRDAVCPHCPGVQTMATGQLAEAETEGVRDDGSRYNVRVQTFPVFGDNGTVRGFIEISEDITERKQAEELLQQERETFSTILENALYGVALIDKEGRYLYVNPEFIAITGYTLDDIPTGRDWMHKVYPDKEYRHKVIEAWKKDRKSGGSSKVFRVVCKDGGIKEIEFRPTLLPDGRAIVMLADITERKRAEEALRQSQKELQTIMDASPIAISWADMQGNILYINRKHHELFGYTLEDIPTIDEWRRQADQDPVQREKFAYSQDELMKAHKEGRSLPSGEMTVTCKDGSIRYVTFEGTIVSDRYLVIFNDITERKQAEDALRESEKRFRLLVEHSKDALFLHDPDGKIIDVNRHACESLGYTREELLGLSIHDIDEGVSTDQLKEKWEQMVPGEPVTLEGVHRRKDRTTFPVEVRLGVFEAGGRRLLLGLVRDVTERKQAEEALRTSEQHFRTLFEESLDGICLADAETGIIIDCNDALAALVCRERTELIGKPQTILHPPQDDKAAFSPTFKQHLTTKEGQILETQVVTRTSGIREVEIKANSLDLQGRKLLQGVFHDITERKRAEQALRENQEELQALMDASPVAIAWADMQGNILYINRKHHELFGYTLEEIPTIDEWRRQADQDPVQRERFAHWQEELMEVHRDGRSFPSQEMAVTCKDGSIRHVIVGGTVAFNRTMATYNDITERKQSEELLQRERETFSTILENALYGVVLMGRRGEHLYVNPAFTAITGYALEDIPTGRDWMHKAYPDETYRQKVREFWNKDGGFIGTAREVSIVCKDGQIKEIEFRRTQLADGRAVVMLTDITERKRAEQELRESREELQALMDGSPLAISWADMHENILYINRRHHELFGYTLEDIPTIAAWRRQADRDPAQRERFARWPEELIEAHKQGRSLPPREMTVTCKDGSIRYVTIEGTIVSGRNMAIFNDITERKLMQEQLQKSEELHRTLIETTKVGVSAINENGVIFYANERLCEIWGYALDEIMRHRIAEFLDEDNLKVLQEQLAKRGKGRRDPYEIVWTSKDKRQVSTIIAPTPIFDADGHYKGSYGFITDITERKRAEERLRHYAAELERSNAEVKNFAYIVSHDLRVPLVNLKGYSAELRSALDVIGSNLDAALPYLNDEKRSEVAMALHEDAPEALEFITTSVSRMDSFINAVLLLSRLGRRDLKPEPIDMNALVQATLGTLSHQIEGRGITVTVEPLPQLVADRTSMEQVMGNILSNAVKYLDSSRPGQIEVSAKGNGMETVFSIRDNGRGIAQEDMDKVFAPFRRAGKQDTPGEGMGLAYVQTLVRRHNGRIWCESELGKGTTFTFTIAPLPVQGA